MRFPISEALHKRARKASPNGVHSAARWAPALGRFEARADMPAIEYPKFIKRASGSHIYDVDGNDYVDYFMALGPVIIGHSDAVVNEAVRRQMDDGVIFGMSHEAEIELSELICKHVPSAQLVNLVTSGSEATAAAIRLARAHTKRRKIVKFKDHYHSWHDWSRFTQFASEMLPEVGIVSGVVDDTIQVPWNDSEVLERSLKEHQHELAGVICEPFLGNFGCISPEQGYLSILRELTEKYNVVLIFDEVVSGFRLGLGGAQKEFGVTPDLTTFAKAMANGYPIGAVAGRKDIMSNKAYVGGTYNSNPISTVASIACIRQLEDEQRFSSMLHRGRELIRGIQETANDARVECVVQGMPSLFAVLFGFTEPVTRTEKLHQVTLDPHLRRCAAYIQGMVDNGVFNASLSRSARWCLSLSHSDEDVEDTLAAAEKAMKLIAAIQ